MEFLTNILGAILRFIYQSLTNIGSEPEIISYYAISLILMAILQKIITIPLNLQSAKNSREGMALQPEVEKIMNRYKHDPDTQNRKIMQLYEEHNYKPGGGCTGCVTMIIPLIIIIAMLRVVREPESYIVAGNGIEIAKNFFWIPDLSQPDPTGFAMPLIYSLSMLAYTYISQKAMVTPASQSDEMMQTNKIMMYIMPIMFFFIGRSWASGILLYWAAGLIIEIIVRLILQRDQIFNAKED